MVLANLGIHDEALLAFKKALKLSECDEERVQAQELVDDITERIRVRQISP
jgi:hypothetical protein